MKKILIDLHIPNIPILPFRLAPIPPWKLLCADVCNYFFGLSKRNFTDVELRTVFCEHAESHEPSVFIFMDGSKSSAGVGFGVHTDDLIEEVLFPPLLLTIRQNCQEF